MFFNLFKEEKIKEEKIDSKKMVLKGKVTSCGKPVLRGMVIKPEKMSTKLDKLEKENEEIYNKEYDYFIKRFKV